MFISQLKKKESGYLELERRGEIESMSVILYIETVEDKISLSHTHCVYSM